MISYTSLYLSLIHIFGIDRTRPFVEWLKTNNLRGFIGEYGVPGDDERWLVCLDNFLDYLSKENINGTYWAAGAQWNKYILSIHPDDNYQTDKIQLGVLTKYLETDVYKRQQQGQMGCRIA